LTTFVPLTPGADLVLTASRMGL